MQRLRRIARKEYLYPVDFEFPAGVPADPTGLPVQFAVMPSGQKPQPGDWVAGSWEKTPGGKGNAVLNVSGDQCSIAAGAMFTLGQGRYDVYLQPIRSGKEAPAEIVDQIEVID